MIAQVPDYTQFLLLADESANWKISGLRQLDRLILALNEFAECSGDEIRIDIVVFWKPEIPIADRWLPQHPRSNRSQLNEQLDALGSGARILSTRLFVDRNGLAKFLSAVSFMKLQHSILEPEKSWRELSAQFSRACATHGEGQGWYLLDDASNLSKCTTKFLNDAGKPQDGVVSRFLNRPISRLVTRLLLKGPISPAAWTISIFILPLLASPFLLRGDYAGVVTGAALFQLYSILDGCDGEIARAKYLESARGAWLDDFFDMLGSLLFVTALGLGLTRTHSNGVYAVEGIICAMVIAANEWVLRSARSNPHPGPTALAAILYPRHHGLVQNSGVLLMGENLVHWVIQLTKRDVAILFFLLLALANLPQWILHLWLTIAAVTLVLGGIARFRVDADRRALAQPDPRS